MGLNHQQKIIALWSVFLFGTIFHTQLALIPLFHGLNVATANSQEPNDISEILWLMLGFFVLPMVAIVATAFNDYRHYKRVHFGLTVFYTVMNLLHVVLDLFVTPIVWSQITLMVILFMIGLLLNIVAFQWMQQRINGKLWQNQKQFINEQ